MGAGRRKSCDTMLNFYGKTFTSRLLIGSALYPSPAIMQGAIRASGANIVTVSLRREAAGGKTGDAFWSLIRELDVTVLPNTAGCRSVREAVDRKSTRLNSSHDQISYAVFCLKKKKKEQHRIGRFEPRASIPHSDLR